MDAFVLVFAMVFPTVMATTYFIMPPPATGSDVILPLYTIGKIIQFSLPVAYVLSRDRSSLRSLSLNRAGINAGLTFGVVAVVTTFYLYEMLKDRPLFDSIALPLRQNLSKFGAGSVTGFIVLALILSVIHSWMEEYYWRWFVFGRLRKYIPMFPASVIAGIAFAAHHVIILHVYFPGHFFDAVLPFSLAVVIGGMVWAWIYERTGSLLGPWISHIMIDLALFVVGWQLLSHGSPA